MRGQQLDHRSAGGTTTVPSAGFSPVVPPFAVTSGTSFHVHVRPGVTVAYEFEPHGTKFAVPLTAIQDSQNTTTPVATLSFKAGYFANRSQLISPTLAGVSEELPASTALNGSVVMFKISHFLGYLVSSGRQ